MILTVVCLTHLCFAIAGLSMDPWTDEVRTLTLTGKTFGELWESYYSHRTYVLFAKVFSQGFDDPVTGIRIPALLFSLISIVAVYFLARDLSNSMVGHFAALYMIAHPIFLQAAKEARGYTGVVLFLTLASWLLSRGCLGKRFWMLVLCIPCAYVAYLFHPTAALVFPGLFLWFLIFGSQLFLTPDSGEKRSTLKKYLITSIPPVLVGGILFYPYLQQYIASGSLFIPGFLTEQNQEALTSVPLHTLSGGLYNLSPLLTSRGHTGLKLVFPFTLFLIGFLGCLFRNARTASILCFPILSGFGFLSLLSLNWIPTRYLIAMLPFVVVVVSMGAHQISSLSSFLVPPKFKRFCYAFAMVAQLAMTILACWAPLQAELRHPYKPGHTYYRPLVAILQTEPFDDAALAMVRNDRLKNGLTALGLNPSRIEEFTKEEEPEMMVERLVTSAGEQGIWIVLPSIEFGDELSGLLADQGFEYIEVVDIACRFHHPQLDGDLSGRKNVLEPVFAKLLHNSHNSPTSAVSASNLARRHKLNGFSDRFISMARRKIVVFERFDAPGRLNDILRFKRSYYNSEGKPLLAVQAYLEYSKGTPTFEFIFRDLFERFPSSLSKRIVELEEFDPKQFVAGYLSVLERDHPKDQEYRAYWSAKVGGYLEEAGSLPAACDMYRYSLEQEDILHSLAARRLLTALHKGGQEEEAIGATIDLLKNHRLHFLFYRQLIETFTPEQIGDAAKRNEINQRLISERITFSLENEKDGTENLEREHPNGGDYPTYWAVQMGKFFEAAGLDESASTLYAYAVRNGDINETEAVGRKFDVDIRLYGLKEAGRMLLETAATAEVSHFVWQNFFSVAQGRDLVLMLNESPISEVEFAEKICKGMARVESFSSEDRAYEAYHIAVRMFDAQKWKAAKRLFLFARENGDPDGRAEIGLRTLQEMGKL